MRFKGANKKLGMWFEVLISIYGEDAKISDIEKSIMLVR